MLLVINHTGNYKHKKMHRIKVHESPKVEIRIWKKY